MITVEKSIAPWISIADESLSIENNYDLYVIVSNDVVQLALSDNDRNKFVALNDYNISGIKPEHIAARIESILESDELAVKYKSTLRRAAVSFAGNNCTIVPSAFYEENKKEQLLAFNMEANPNEMVMADRLRQLDAMLIYSVNKELAAALSNLFPAKTFHHAANGLLEATLLQHKNEEEKVVTINVSHTGFDLVITEGKKLHYYNYFSYQSTEDFIYYILFACEQLQLNPETTPFYFSGMIEKNSALYLLAQKYMRHLRFIQRPDFCDYSYKFKDIQQHYHVLLYNQFLCAL